MSIGKCFSFYPFSLTVYTPTTCIHIQCMNFMKIHISSYCKIQFMLLYYVFSFQTPAKL